MFIKPYYKATFCLATLLLLSACDNATNKIAEPLNSEESIEVIKSPNDDRSYRAITLDNSMEVLLVSDPETEKSAAALSLGVGYYYDPIEQQGLAHFLEHMLSKGSDKYPGTSEFNEFLDNNAGTRNASTSTEVTNYMFSVKNGAYAEALDRFSEFFKTPKLYPEYTDKEKNAVDAEASMSIENDWRAQWRLTTSLMGSHAANRFTTGNLETLGDKEGSLLHPEMVAFYNKYYSANIMKLVLLSNAGLDEIEKQARKYFSTIEDKGIAEPEITDVMPDFAKKRVYFVPNNDVKEIRLDFVIKNNQAQFAVKPNIFIAHLIGSEMPGTPAYILKEQGLISSLSADAIEYLFGNYGRFEINISLTEKGLKQRDFIVATLMQYINLIKQEGVDEKYFKEIQTALNNQFRFLEKRDEFSYVRGLASSMQDYPIENILNAAYHYTKFDKAAINATLEQFTPDNLLVWYTSKDEEADQDIEFYAGKYRIEDLSAAEISSWSQASSLALALPQANRLMPENFDIVVAGAKEGDKPSLSFDNEGVQIWNFPSQYFADQPKGLIRLMINTPDEQINPAAKVMQSLWASLYNLQQSALATEAQVAGMGLGLTASNGLTLSISGFTDKHDVLIEKAFDQLVVEVTPENFSQAVDRYVRGVQNTEKQRAVSQAFGIFRQMTASGNYDNDMLIKTAESLSVQDFKTFMQKTLDNNLIRVFTYGNYDQAAINELLNNIDKLRTEGRTVTKYSKTRYWQPIKGNTFVYRADIPVEDIGMIDIFVHPVPGYQSKAAGAILLEHYHRLAFDQLRTEEQLGYIVQGVNSSIDEYSTLGLLIQTPVKNVQDIQARFDAFNSEYAKSLETLTEEEFQQLKTSRLTNLQEKPKNLSEEVSPLISDWIQEKFDFDSRQKLIDATEKVTLADVKDFFKQTIGNKDAARISIQMRGKKFVDQPFVSFDNEVVIENLSDFHAKAKYQ